MNLQKMEQDIRVYTKPSLTIKILLKKLLRGMFGRHQRMNFSVLDTKTYCAIFTYKNKQVVEVESIKKHSRCFSKI